MIKTIKGNCSNHSDREHQERTKQNVLGHGLGVVVFGRGPGLLQICARVYCRAMRLDVHRARKIAKAAPTAGESSGET